MLKTGPLPPPLYAGNLNSISMARLYDNFFPFPGIDAAGNYAVYSDPNGIQPLNPLAVRPQNPTTVPSNVAFAPRLSQNDCDPRSTLPRYLGEVRNDQVQPQFPDFMGWNGSPPTGVALEPPTTAQAPSSGKPPSISHL